METTREFSDRDALDLIIRKLRVANDRIASVILETINDGKVTVLRERQNVRQQKGVRRVRERFSDREALSIALDIVRSYCVELPMIAASARDDIGAATVSVAPRRGLAISGELGVREESVATVQFEMQTEAQFEGDSSEFVPLEAVSKGDLAELERLVSEVYEATGL